MLLRCNKGGTDEFNGIGHRNIMLSLHTSAFTANFCITNPGIIQISWQHKWCGRCVSKANQSNPRHHWLKGSSEPDMSTNKPDECKSSAANIKYETASNTTKKGRSTTKRDIFVKTRRNLKPTISQYFLLRIDPATKLPRFCPKLPLIFSSQDITDRHQIKPFLCSRICTKNIDYKNKKDMKCYESCSKSLSSLLVYWLSIWVVSLKCEQKRPLKLLELRRSRGS